MLLLVSFLGPLFGRPDIPNQIFEWVGSRQQFCSQLPGNAHSNLQFAGESSKELLPSMVSGFQLVLTVSRACCSGSTESASCC